MLSIQDALLQLGITADVVDLKLVRTQHRALLLKWHPDLHQEPVKKAEAEFKAKTYNNAYDVAKAYFENHKEFTLKSSQRTYVSPESKRKTGAATNSQKHSYFAASGIDEVFVESSCIQSIAFDINTKTLYIRFLSVSIYAYFNVPEEVWRSFQVAPSKGRFLRSDLYAFRYERLA